MLTLIFEINTLIFMERILKECLAKKGSYSGGVHDLLAPELTEFYA